MLALPKGRSSLLHLLQRQAHELLEQVPKNGGVHAHLHNALHAATHQLVLKLLQDDGTHGVMVLRQQMVVHTACMWAQHLSSKGRAYHWQMMRLPVQPSRKHPLP